MIKEAQISPRAAAPQGAADAVYGFFYKLFHR